MDFDKSLKQKVNTEQFGNDTNRSAISLLDNRPKKVLQKEQRNAAEIKQQANAIQLTNNTGLPNNLKSGIENLSGYSMDDVKVHYNSSQPAQLNAHAFAQGTNIHIAPGEEKHLPHEAWHVVQQKQGRVKPTMQMKGKVNVNDDVHLEREADVMGEKAVQLFGNTNKDLNGENILNKTGSSIIQKKGITLSDRLVNRVQPTDMKTIQRVLSLRHATPAIINSPHLVLLVNVFNSDPTIERLAMVSDAIAGFQRSDPPFFHDMNRQIEAEMAILSSVHEDENIDFKQKELLGEEVCYGLSMAWINARSNSAKASNANLKRISGIKEIHLRAKDFQSKYIVNGVGKGPIFNYLREHIGDLRDHYSLGARPGRKETEVGKTLSNHDIWEKEALYAARMKHHKDAEQSMGKLKRVGPQLMLHNKSIGGILDIADTGVGMIRNFAIIILEGTKGGHAIAVQKVMEGKYVYFDPDFGQRSASPSGIKERIEFINSILDLNSIQFEFFSYV